MNLLENYKPTSKNLYFDHWALTLKPMYDWVAEGIKSEQMRLGMGQRVKDHQQSTTQPAFPQPCAGDYATHSVMKASAHPAGAPTFWGRQTPRGEPNCLEAGRLGEVDPGSPNY